MPTPELNFNDFISFRIVTKRPLLPAKMFPPLIRSNEIGMTKILSTIDRRRRKQLKREIRRQERERRAREGFAGSGSVNVPLPCWPEHSRKDELSN